MNWTAPRELKAQLARLWERGELLRALLDNAALFPLRLALKGPNSAELGEHFEAARAWVAELAGMPHIRLEWRMQNHRVQGQQRLPQGDDDHRQPRILRPGRRTQYWIRFQMGQFRGITVFGG